MEILIAGDFYPCKRIKKLINEKSYEQIFSNVGNLIKSCDYSIVNLEAPVLSSKATPIEKTGPHLSCSHLAVEAIKYAGFKAVSLANNHFYDFGEKGVKETLNTLSNYSIDYVGGGKNIQEAERIHYIEIEGKRIGFINFCENEWSIATENSGGSAPLNPIKNHYIIKEAKKNANYVIVITHGGTEHYQLPSPKMQEKYRFFIDSGADVLVNHHQHCYSGYEIYKNKPIFYGLGNFCFDSNSSKRNNLWEEGFLLKVIINETLDFNIIPYIQCGDEPTININVDLLAFNKKINELNQVIESPTLLREKYYELIQKARRDYLTGIEPIHNRHINALQRKKLLPLLNRKKQKLLLLNLIRCESHKDLLEQSLIIRK